MTQVYNQNTFVGLDGKTNIERFMESVVKYCDSLVVFDDGSTDDTRDYIASHSHLIEVQILSNLINTPDKEGFHRARSIEHCRRMGADWVLCLDPDEVFEQRAESGAMRALCEMNHDSISFHRADLWRTDKYIRVDNGWSGRVDSRLYRLTKKLSYDTKGGPRSTLIPNKMSKLNTVSNLKIVHFGYSTDWNIVSKYLRFKNLGIDLAEHLSDSNIRLSDINPKWLSTEPNGLGIEAYDKQISDILRVV